MSAVRSKTAARLGARSCCGCGLVGPDVKTFFVTRKVREDFNRICIDESKRLTVEQFLVHESWETLAYIERSLCRSCVDEIRFEAIR